MLVEQVTLHFGIMAFVWPNNGIFSSWYYWTRIV